MPNERAFIDTSAFIALRDSKDINHTKSKSILIKIKKKKLKLITTNFILDEIYTFFCRYHEIAVEMGNYIINSPRIIEYHRLTVLDETNAWEIAKRHRDKTYSFTDCTSFSLCNRLKVKKVFAFDDHFRQFGEFELLGD